MYDEKLTKKDKLKISLEAKINAFFNKTTTASKNLMEKLKRREQQLSELLEKEDEEHKDNDCDSDSD